MVASGLLRKNAIRSRGRRSREIPEGARSAVAIALWLVTI